MELSPPLKSGGNMVSLGTDAVVKWFGDHRLELVDAFKSAGKAVADSSSYRTAVDKLYDAWSMVGMKHRCVPARCS
jgi:hypothetical protein